MIVLQLSREEGELAKAEATALFGTTKELDDELLLIKADAKLLPRLVFTRFAGMLLYKTDTLDKLGLLTYKSFAVRVSKLGGKQSSAEIIRAVAAKVKGKVDLKNPKTVIRVFTNGKKYWVTEQLYEYKEKDFSERDVNARLVFHPTSLQPKYGRLLINLAGVTKGKILDPFCGVGGIVLEAADMGLRAQGIEIDEKYAEGATENAWFYRMEKKIKIDNEDFLKWKGKKYDAIVTDLPYGKSSGLFGKELDELYFEAFKKMKTHSSKLVVMGQKDLTPLLKKAGWKVSKRFDFYVHKSMRRYIHICTI